MMLVNDRAEPDVLQSFLEREVGPEAKEAVVTPGQRLIEQGIQQGKVEGERELLLRQLRQRFGTELDPETERRIATATEIEAWALRVLGRHAGRRAGELSGPRRIDWRHRRCATLPHLAYRMQEFVLVDGVPSELMQYRDPNETGWYS